MNTGLIPTRYATALLEYEADSGAQHILYAEAKAIVDTYTEHSNLRTVMENPVLTIADKKEIIHLSTGKKLSEPLSRFVDLLLANKREQFLREIMLKYIELYRRKNNIWHAKLTTAYPVSTETEERLLKMVQTTKGGTLELEKNVDPNVLGGFIFEADFERWDASVSGQLRRIKQEYIEKNKKTV